RISSMCIRFWQKYNKFFPAITRDKVHMTDRILDGFGNGRNDIITFLMPIRIVVILKEIYIDKQNRQSRLFTACTFEMDLHRLIKSPSIGHLGQFIVLTQM